MKKKITLKEVKAERYDFNLKKIPFNQVIIGKISPYFSYLFLRFFPKITPNQITFGWMFISLVSFVVMCIGGYWYLLAGILIYHFALLGDYIDGEVARVTGIKTLGGTYLDKVISYISRGLLVLGVGIGVYNANGNIIYLYLGIWSTLFLVYNNLDKLKVYETFIQFDRLELIKDMKKAYKEEGFLKFKKSSFLQKVKSFTIESLRPANPFSLIFWAILFNVPEIYLILMAVVSPYAFTKSFISIYKRIGNIKE